MERVLVTGGCGYIGRHVVDELFDRGCDVYLSDPSADPATTRAHVVDQPIFSWDETAFQKLGSPTRCIHLAWTDGFVHNAPSHIENLPAHVDFIRNLTESGIASITVMGTMHEVGYWEGPIDENTPTNPLSFYAIAKNSLRQCCEVITSSSNTSLKWLRGFYIIGDETHNNSVFTKIAQAAADGKTSFPFTSGKNLYDFIDIDELACQIVAATLQDEIAGIINCCSGTPISLGEKVEEFIQQRELDITLDYGAFPDRPYDSPGIWGDNTRIASILKKQAAIEP